jgi:hypothetical protein
MLASGQPMFLLIPSPSKTKYLYPGTVIKSDRTSFTAKFEDAIMPEVGSDVIAFCESNQKFCQQGAKVREILVGDEVGIVFERVGEVVSAESRESYRVSTAATEMTVGVGKESTCPVLDLSNEGFAAVTAKKLTLGSVVPVTLHGEGHALETTARVQTVRERPDGKFRCGFLVPRDDAAARKTLQQLTSLMQRLQLQRIRGVA